MRNKLLSFENSKLEDFDFSPINEYLLANKNKSKAKSSEEKKDEKEKTRKSKNEEKQEPSRKKEEKEEEEPEGAPNYRISITILFFYSFYHLIYLANNISHL